MSEADLLGELNFVLEFNLLKEISDSQELINYKFLQLKFQCHIGYKPRPIKNTW